MLAIPLATMRVLVLANSHGDAETTSRPTASGIHSAPYPQASTRFANAAVSAADRASVPAQTPKFLSFIACSTVCRRLNDIWREYAWQKRFEASCRSAIPRNGRHHTDADV